MTGHKKLNYGRHSISSAEIDSVVDVLTSDFLTQGPTVERFEAKICSLTGAKHAIAFSSGTAALHAAACAADLGAGDLGITQAITFCASANMFRFCNADVAFTDVNPVTLNMCPESLKSTIEIVLAEGLSLKAVTPVHMGGLSCCAKDIREVAKEHVLIEDASHSFGARYEDGKIVGCGAYSDITVFSFHPVKPITTAEGGVAVTNDSVFASKLRLMRSHGIERNADLFVDPFSDGGLSDSGWYYEQQTLGYNYRMSDIHAAIGVAQIDRLTEFNERRQSIAMAYDTVFEGHPYIRPLQMRPEYRIRSANHLYIVMVDYEKIGVTRGQVMELLKRAGIGTQVHYIPVYRHPYYRELYPDLKLECFQAAENYYLGALTLPLFPGMTEEDVQFVANQLMSIASI
ncbi:UDP-4-amino-4,6-dideoxy-N-acetyl-beta-L-altrosamine transaminase [Thalassospira sp.]|uniref:UDP-4-amino-4, 6-dideoxy-N-acetyl-beta-L-altrosamine transaminase n=1 Tax=Thalassospira sp. TaxID=1912094 RepID=UPI001B139986|nr:UDP-4-amino-4,6-dideoxy-N-acetyl-beta-L-altrosamine transaminase [Thalassospira sp.]MBO6805978.1 UDP-4-amino-4,6-dideoxy-N-acetyl-beta-L-altrosamine transaminase [Thalassospira sp.]